MSNATHAAMALLMLSMLAVPLPSAAANLTIDYTPLEELPGAITIPYGINSAGNVSGTALYFDDFGFEGSVGFLWNKATQSYTVIDLGAVRYTQGRGLNNAGVVVGGFTASRFEPPDEFGFTYDSVTGNTTVYPLVRWRGISNAGDLAGSLDTGTGVVGVRYWQGQSETFSCFGVVETYPQGINVAGEVVGTYFHDDTGNAGAFLYRNGACIDISIPNAVHSFAWGINDLGDVVGEYLVVEPSNQNMCKYRGAFHRHDGQLDTTRIACTPTTGNDARNRDWLNRPVASVLFSINNERIVTGLFDSRRPFYGAIRGAKPE